MENNKTRSSYNGENHFLFNDSIVKNLAAVESKVKITDAENEDKDEAGSKKVKEYNAGQVANVLINIIKNDSAKNRDQRVVYANKIYIMLVGWSLVIVAILFLQGFKVFNLSSDLIMLLVGTVFMEIMGLFVLVANYLFKESSYMQGLIDHTFKKLESIDLEETEVN